jgi:hypothetical protein
MVSKYDDFWIQRLQLLDDAIQSAASGRPTTVDVTGITRLGDRQSWAGIAFVRGRVVLDAAMAHATSLANVVSSSGACDPWPDRRFRLSINAAGTRLTITCLDLAGRQPPLLAAEQVAPHAAAPAAAVVTVDADATAACARLHRILASLPAHHAPKEVPFANGLYFFYEDGQTSPHGNRIVRIGNHPRAQDRLIERLGDHYNNRVGAKNFSVFRRYLGGALLRRDDPAHPCLQPAPGQGHWEQQNGALCSSCAPVEQRVTDLLHARFCFRCIRIDDMALRNELEKRLIATVAQCRDCAPTSRWLGRHAYPPLVQSTGLWNTQHVEAPPATIDQIDLVEQLSAADQYASLPSLPQLAAQTLLVIPCSGRKEPRLDMHLAEVKVGDLIGAETRAILEEGRRRAFALSSTQLHEESPLLPALAYYAGQPYATAGVRNGLMGAVRAGVHVVIVSGGYGAVRAEERIHPYNAHLGTQTRHVWSSRLPSILRDYVARQGITRSFVLLSSQYAACVPQLTPDEYRFVPTFDRARDGGSAMQVVPAKIGEELRRQLPKVLFSTGRASLP